VRHYGKKLGKTVLKEKCLVFSNEEVCVGNTLDILNNIKYNTNMLNRLKNKHKKSLGCEVKIIGVSSISQCGYTNDRFENCEQAT